MSNPFNAGNVMGHAAAAPKIFPNSKGGATVKLSVFARNAYVSKSTGQVESEIEELTGYIADIAAGHGVYAHINTGDRVAVSYSLKTERFTDKDGNEHFPLVARIDTVQLVDTKAEAAARAARRGAQPQAQQPQVPMMPPAMAGVAPF